VANKDDVVRKMRELQGEIEGTVSSMSEESWSRGVYRKRLERAPAAQSYSLDKRNTRLRAGFDEDGFNARLVAEREGKSTAELLGEIKGNFERDVEAVRAAPDELIRKQFRAPWGVEGGVGDVIVESLKGHLGMHLVDLRFAVD